MPSLCLVDIGALVRRGDAAVESHTMERIVIKCEDMQRLFARVDRYMTEKWARKSFGAKRRAYRSFCTFTDELADRYQSLKGSLDDLHDASRLASSASTLRTRGVATTDEENTQPLRASNAEPLRGEGSLRVAAHM